MGRIRLKTYPEGERDRMSRELAAQGMSKRLPKGTRRPSGSR
ncbi:MAG: hypothetical protein OEW90_13450 [Betaproteobacteria bacterium]|nr:hypothetical protein [Betaproteobacteria bacterium]